MMVPRRALLQAAPGAPLQLSSPPASPRPESLPEGEEEALLQVVACCPSSWDGEAAPPDTYPRTPGNVLAATDRAGQLWLCAGLLPCGACGPCQAGLHLACDASLRPGWTGPGGLASHVELARRAFLAPALTGADAAAAVALLAAAGPTYQAAACANMAPGDTVVVWGDPGPGALPLRLLVETGQRPLWICGAATATATAAAAAAAAALPAGVERLTAAPSRADLPTPRCHLIDLQPSEASIAAWLPLVPACLSCLLVGARLRIPAAPALAQLLAGQATLRWVRDLHPHLALDVAALARRMDAQLQPWIERRSLEQYPAAFAALWRGEAERWPVLVP